MLTLRGGIPQMVENNIFKNICYSIVESIGSENKNGSDKFKY